MRMKLLKKKLFLSVARGLFYFFNLIMLLAIKGVKLKHSMLIYILFLINMKTIFK